MKYETGCLVNVTNQFQHHIWVHHRQLLAPLAPVFHRITGVYKVCRTLSGFNTNNPVGYNLFGFQRD